MILMCFANGSRIIYHLDRGYETLDEIFCALGANIRTEDV